MKNLKFVRCAAAALCLCLLTGAASARSSKEIRGELDVLQQQEAELAAAREALEAELAANADETTTVIGAKSALDRRIHLIEAEIRNAQAQIQQHNLLVARSQEALEAAQEAHAQRNQAYRDRIRAMEEHREISYWAILFQASSFSDLLDRVNMIREVAEADQMILRELAASAEAIEQQQLQLQQEIEAQQATLAWLQELEAELETQRAASDAMLVQLAEAEKMLSEEYLAAKAEEDALREELIAAQLAYEAALSAEEAARLAEQNKNNAAGGGGSAGKSGFLCPLPPGAWVTSAFGYRNHPLHGYYQLHTGVDLAANQGTEIYATAAGTVTRAGYTEPNGYYVALSHGGGYGSIYLHMTHYTVAVGDSVKQGQVIGYVGSTGWSSGPHLHFEIHKDGTPVNPMEYISLN